MPSCLGHLAPEAQQLKSEQKFNNPKKRYAHHIQYNGHDTYSYQDTIHLMEYLVGVVLDTGFYSTKYSIMYSSLKKFHTVPSLC